MQQQFSNAENNSGLVNTEHETYMLLQDTSNYSLTTNNIFKMEKPVNQNSGAEENAGMNMPY